jgi:small-conductance mechanosensitive channel
MEGELCYSAQSYARLVFYVIVVIFAVAALREAGFSLDVVLGAAGILTVAIGFASQTSASNMISGLFLLVEKHPTCLKEPNPFVLVTGFGQSSVDVQFSFWVPREKLKASRSSMMIAVKKMLDREKIEIPFPTPAFTPVAIQNPSVCS